MFASVSNSLPLLLLLLGVAHVVHAYPDGAGECMQNADDVESFSYHHGGPTRHNDVVDGMSSLVISVGGIDNVPAPQHIVSGCDYQVAVCARRAFNGLLLYSSVADDVSTRIGTFSIPVAYAAHFQYKQCSGGSERSTVTHTHAEQYSATRIDFVWRAPTLEEAGAANADGDGADHQVRLRVTGVFSSQADWLTAATPSFSLMSSTLSCPPITRPSACPSVAAVTLATDPAVTMAADAVADPHTGHDMSGVADTAAEADPHSAHSSASGGGGHTVVFNTAWQGLPLIWESWTIDSKGVYIFTMLVVFAMSLSLEALQAAHFELAVSFRRRGLARPATQTLMWRTPLHEWQYAVLTLLHIFRVFLGMLLMMVFMTLEKGLVTAMISGYGVGFYLFYRRRFRYSVPQSRSREATKRDSELVAVISGGVGVEVTAVVELEQRFDGSDGGVCGCD